MICGGQTSCDGCPTGPPLVPVSIPPVTARMAITATMMMPITNAAPAIHQPMGVFFFSRS